MYRLYQSKGGDMFGSICLSVCLGLCELYAVHHLNDTGLWCAMLACDVHHQPALCIMVHKGDLCP